MTDGGGVLYVEIDPRSAFAVYLADQAVDEEWELFRVDLDGSGAPRRVNGPLVPGGRVGYDFVITRDSRAVVYLAEQDVVEQLELYRASLDPRGTVAKLNGPMTAGGDILFFHVAPDGRRVFYMANQDDVNAMELYLSSPLPGVRVGL